MRQNTKIERKCEHCGTILYRRPKYTHNKVYCSKKCKDDFRKGKHIDWVKPLPRVTVTCKQCGINIERLPSELKGTNSFCSYSCNSSYNSARRKHGSTSKLERWLKNNLPLLVNSPIIFNDRKTLDGLELDIHIPLKNIAIELNGPGHYWNVYGDDALCKTKFNDEKKKELCKLKGINLIIIDVSKDKNFTIKIGEQRAKDIIEQINKSAPLLSCNEHS